MHARLALGLIVVCLLAASCTAGTSATATAGSDSIVPAIGRQLSFHLTVPAGLPETYRLAAGVTGVGVGNKEATLAYKVPGMAGAIDVVEQGPGSVDLPAGLAAAATVSVAGKEWKLLGNYNELTRSLDDGVVVQIETDPTLSTKRRRSAMITIAAAIDRGE